MGIMRRRVRRRAIVGAAAAGGAAYAAGRRHERRKEEEMAAQEAEYEEPEVDYAPPPAPPAHAEKTPLDELERLAKLHEEGVLTDEEFSAAKARQLGIDPVTPAQEPEA